MKTLVQNYATGALEMLDVPSYREAGSSVLVETRASVVSAGTERAMIELARKSLLAKALARPDWVAQVIAKARAEGVAEAWRQSRARLARPVPLGYSMAGVVRDAPRNGLGISKGQRVACVGSGFASHAELNLVPENLCVRLPDNVSFEDAAYTATGSIAMEAIRLAKADLGSTVAIIGLGLLGQIAVQMLRASGCRVIGIDISEERCALARTHGAELTAVEGRDNAIALAGEISNNEGLDAAIILASAKGDATLATAAMMCRERARVVATGLVDLKIPRELFYRKELEFTVSRAWGPGSYDPDYELRGVKYPRAFARWTARQNMEEFLRLVSIGAVSLQRVTTHTFPFEKALDAYEAILSGKGKAIGVVLRYGERDEPVQEKKDAALPARSGRQGETGIGLIGAGLFARGTLLPAMKGVGGIRKAAVCARSGLSAMTVAREFGFPVATTDYKEVLASPDVDIVFILTRHDSHARLVGHALSAGKAVFVEKPLCMNLEELRGIVDAHASASKTGQSFLMTGFNRRFSPLVLAARDLMGNAAVRVLNMRCNAGHIPADSWVHKPDEGGGRIIGEVCHFVDLAQVLTCSLPRKVFATCARGALKDDLAIAMEMENGSAVSMTYTASGDRRAGREYIEGFGNGAAFVIDDFRRLAFFSNGRKRTKRLLGADRGHGAMLKAVIKAVNTGDAPPIGLVSMAATTLATFAMEESIMKNEAVAIDLHKAGL